MSASDKYSVHELLHVANMCSEIVDTHLCNHPTIAEFEELGWSDENLRYLREAQYLIETARDKLAAAYQKLGHIDL